MITFTILAIILLVLAVIVALALGLGGAAFIVVFGDIIVCAAIIIFIVRWLFRRKK